MVRMMKGCTEKMMVVVVGKMMRNVEEIRDVELNYDEGVN